MKSITIEIPADATYFPNFVAWEEYKHKKMFATKSDIFTSPERFPCYGFEVYEVYHPQKDFFIYAFVYPV